MSRVEVRTDRCKGCLLCTLVCPEEMLTQGDKLNSSGYKVVRFREENMEKCKGCGFCAEICPDGALVVFKEALIFV